MTKVITIANQKGGAGKTTTVLNLAHGLALRGREVLILDFDPQGQSASYLGLKQEPGIFFLLMSSIKPLEKNELILLRQQVQHTGRPRLWIIPGSQETAVAQNSLAALDKPGLVYSGCDPGFYAQWIGLHCDGHQSLAGRIAGASDLGVRLCDRAGGNGIRLAGRPEQDAEHHAEFERKQRLARVAGGRTAHVLR